MKEGAGLVAKKGTPEWSTGYVSVLVQRYPYLPRYAYQVGRYAVNLFYLASLPRITPKVWTMETLSDSMACASSVGVSCLALENPRFMEVRRTGVKRRVIVVTGSFLTKISLDVGSICPKWESSSIRTVGSTRSVHALVPPLGLSGLDG